MNKLVALIALLAPVAVNAATYYVSDCQAGAVAGCVQGNDSANGTSPATPWRTYAKAISQFNAMAGGDRVLLAKGGSFSNSGERVVQNTRTTAGNPITLGAYQPSWYSGTQRPIVTQTNNGTVMSFTNGGSIGIPDAGYIVRDLHFRAASNVGTVGMFANRAASDIKFINMLFYNFAIGLYCGNDAYRVTLRDSQVRDNREQGILWSCSNSLIENNLFDNNGYGHTFLDHQMYFSSGEERQTGTVVRGNTLTNSVHYNGNSCTGVPIVGHAKLHSMVFENNRIIERTAAGQGCWGIALDGGYDASEGAEHMANIVVRGNLLVNVGNTGIGCTSCDGWTIENNVIVHEFPTNGYIGISVPNKDQAAMPEDKPTTRLIVRNNSIYFKQPTDWDIGIRIADFGNGHVISSNLIVFGGTAPHASYCFNTQNLAITRFADFSNNLCYGPNTRFNETYNSLLLAQNANPLWNVGGLISNPRLLAVPSASNGFTMALRPASPAINAGDQGICAPRAFGGALRATHCDIGAYEYVAP